MGDNVDVARALACARAHSTSIIFYFAHLAYDFAFCVLRVVVYRFKGKVGFLSFGPSAAFEVSLSESAV